ncbi:MAG TPA: hypothetical protein VEL07_19315 [Planctomycetota bacterium]|nr:hypothetical protein [Planctomycetota bacterium]
MAEFDKTHETHGFGDHHHVDPGKPMRLDPNYRASKETKDAVWKILTEGVPAGLGDEGTIIVPDEYVQTVASVAIRELKREGCGKGFSVAVDPDEPVVKLTFTRAEDLARITQMRSGYELTTDCLTAYVNQLDPVDVGQSAAQAFMRTLKQELAKGN